MVEHRSILVGAAARRSRCPGCSRCVFGYFAFRSRIKGVYFSIITQALTFAAMLLFFRNDTGFGGNNGFTDFKRILGFSDHHAARRAWRFSASPAAMLHRHAAARPLVVTPSSAAC